MLDPKKQHLQIALNSTLHEAIAVINQIPLDKRIIIEAGTPLIKRYGADGIRKIRRQWESRIFTSFGGQAITSLESAFAPSWIKSLNRTVGEKKQTVTSKDEGSFFTPYIVADLKCMDRGEAEVTIAKDSGANAAVCLGSAPPETIDAFIENCEKLGVDAMVDMMNIDFPVRILRKLKKPPKVVMIHRGVDEENFNRESEIPYHEIQRIKNECDILVAVAGGDTFDEARRALFNDADIVVVWKSFYQSTAETAKIAEEFLKEIR